LKGLVVAAVARPLFDGRPIGGVVSVDVDALTAVDVHELVVPVAERSERELLVRAVVARPLLDLGSGGRRTARNVETLAAVRVLEGVLATAGVGEEVRLVRSTVAAAEIEKGTIGGSEPWNVYATAARLAAPSSRLRTSGMGVRTRISTPFGSW
jgi:hypothetical protein